MGWPGRQANRKIYLDGRDHGGADGIDEEYVGLFRVTLDVYRELN